MQYSVFRLCVQSVGGAAGSLVVFVASLFVAAQPSPPVCPPRAQGTVVQETSVKALIHSSQSMLLIPRPPHVQPPPRVHGSPPPRGEPSPSDGSPPGGGEPYTTPDQPILV